MSIFFVALCDTVVGRLLLCIRSLCSRICRERFGSNIAGGLLVVAAREIVGSGDGVQAGLTAHGTLVGHESPLLVAFNMKRMTKFDDHRSCRPAST